MSLLPPRRGFWQGISSEGDAKFATCFSQITRFFAVDTL
eukprot:COSAG06_NODE_28846_length_566_cov_55.012848_2_plen_38_part_01